MAIHDDEQAAEVKAQKQANEARRIRELNKEKAVAELYATPYGRDYLRWLILEVGKAIGLTPFAGESTHGTAFQCGEQNVGLQIMNHAIQVSPIGFTDLLKEGELNARHAAEQRAAAQPSEPDTEPGAESGNAATATAEAEPDTYD